MDTQQVGVGLAAAAAVFALWAAIFATRADAAARKAERRWDAAVRPVPHFNFTSAPAVGQPIELEVENLGGAVAAGVIIVQHGDDLFAGELSLPDRAQARRMLIPPVLKAWQRSGQPRTLMLVARDISGRTWDCLNGGKVIKDPKKWMAAQLREMRLQGILDFPGITGGGK